MSTGTGTADTPPVGDCSAHESAVRTAQQPGAEAAHDTGPASCQSSVHSTSVTAEEQNTTPSSTQPATAFVFSQPSLTATASGWFALAARCLVAVEAASLLVGALTGQILSPLEPLPQSRNPSNPQPANGVERQAVIVVAVNHAALPPLPLR